MLTFKKFEISEGKIIKEWFKSDRLGMKFLAAYATDDFFHLIDFKKRYFWIVCDDDLPVGFFDFEIENAEKGFFSFYVSPEHRGRSVGFYLLREALQLPEITSVKILEGGIEKDNLSSIKTLEKVGFKFIKVDTDGMLIYQLGFK